MTVCIAAIHHDGGIVGTTDKMLTSDDTTFEPLGRSKKIFRLADSINALNAGHVGLQAEIMTSLQSALNVANKIHPKKRYSVKEMVDLYVEHYNQAKNKRINDEVFSKYELDSTSFLTSQKDLSDILIRELIDQVESVQMYETATIIAGVDTSTGWLEPHIYCIRRNSFECCDAVGYATIGSGARHVDAQFMQANFTRHFSLPKVIFLSYLAKRRAEKAPGVGKQTDMFLLGPTLAVNKNLESDLDYKEMNKMYDEIVKSDEAKTESMRQKLAEFLKDKLPFTPSEYDLKNIQSDT